VPLRATSLCRYKSARQPPNFIGARGRAGDEPLRPLFSCALESPMSDLSVTGLAAENIRAVADFGVSVEGATPPIMWVKD
jgi:hypothetical protein